ncbi:MAG TPA: hypothetical protein PKE69_03820 [Pyrinomonadaceae bacterium]|nr:hypothetical protein [Pyrinomonadaceae bacterium]
MTNSELEKRIAVLESQFALLKSEVEKKNETKTPWWEQIAGTFADDPAYDEAMRLGREYRESQKMVYDEDED